MASSRRVTVVDNSHVARAVGERIRRARLRAGLTQAQVSAGRYTAAYISALERGLAKPSMAALTFIAERLSVSVRDLVGGDEHGNARLQTDMLLAAGNHEEALDGYTAILDAAPDRGLRAEALRGRAEALCRLGRGEEAIRSASEAAELFGTIGRAADAALARYWLASGHYLEDNTVEARSLLQETLAEHRAGLDMGPDFRFRVLTMLGQVEGWEGYPERALTYLEEARALTDALDVRQRAAFLSSLALQYRGAGDLERSVRAGMQSLALYETAESEREQGVLENNLAMTYLRIGNLDRAAEYALSAGDIAARAGDETLGAEVAETKARIAFARGDEAGAERLIEDVLVAVERGVSVVAGASAYATRAMIQRARGDRDGAAQSYAAAAELLRDRGPRGRLRPILADWAELMEETGDFATANRLYAEALGRGPGDRVGTGRERALSDR